MTRFAKTITIAATAFALAAPTVGAESGKFVPGVTDFPSANRTEKFVPGATDFPSVHRTGTGYHAVVSSPRPAPAPLAADRFAWGDAGIGAGVGVVLTLLAVGSALALRRQTGALA
ncbi:MAG: hypothetical protein ICV67_01685 [Thermoleophilia bacterium]|nr:hypothetical protein [Thermoleophilia bacterium]